MDRAEHLEPFYPQAEVHWLAAPRSPGVGIDDMASTETTYSAHQVSMQSNNFAHGITLLMQATCRWSMPSHGITLLMVDCGRVFRKAKRRSALVEESFRKQIGSIYSCGRDREFVHALAGW
uniref:Uncharacterized protein n=1 Tax=Oryza barthii TaxID=65489 RepID=A0A0D3EYF4_9ORYZ